MDINQLEKLAKLKEKGIITEEEFKIQKAKILNPTSVTSGNKKQSIYCVLALFLGGFGVHNFYAGRWKRGLAQLFIGLLSFSYLLSGIIGSFIIFITSLLFIPVSLIWPIINIFAIDTDGTGKIFKLSPVARCICGILRILWCLAWMVFLVIGGIAGYTLAMNRYRANEILNAAALVSIAATSANGGEGMTTNLSELGGVNFLILPCIDKDEDITSTPDGIVMIKINETCQSVGQLVKQLSGNRVKYSSKCNFDTNSCIIVDMGSSLKR